MREIIYDVAVSLDGFIAGQGGDVRVRQWRDPRGVRRRAGDLARLQSKGAREASKGARCASRRP